MQSEGLGLLLVLDLLRMSGGALLYRQALLRLFVVVDYNVRGLPNAFVYKRR